MQRQNLDYITVISRNSVDRGILGSTYLLHADGTSQTARTIQSGREIHYRHTKRTEV